MNFPARLLRWQTLLETAGENTKKQVHDEIKAYREELLKEPRQEDVDIEGAFEREAKI